MDPLLRRSFARDRNRADATACPDAELLAAFADGELTGEERREIHAHAADCQRCSDILALTVAAQEEEPGTAVAAGSPIDRRPRTDRAAVAAPTGGGYSSRENSGLGAWSRRRAFWAVPLATAATIAGFWIASSRESARRREPSSAPAPTGQLARVEEAPANPLREEPGGAAAGNATGRATGATLPDRQAAGPDNALKSQAATPQSAAADETRPLAREAPAPPQGESAAAAAPPAIGPPPGRTGAVAETIEVAPIQIAAPDGRTLWRASGRAIERSADGGTTWIAELTAPRRLTAGVAVSADVAWLGGEQGLVLRRTNDAWSVVTSPAAETIAGIRATSAVDASVTLASGRTLRTSDAGARWR